MPQEAAAKPFDAMGRRYHGECGSVARGGRARQSAVRRTLNMDNRVAGLAMKSKAAPKRLTKLKQSSL